MTTMTQFSQHPHPVLARMSPGFFLKPVLCVAGLLLAAITVGHAQESAEKTATARFTVWGDWKGKDLYVKKPGTSSNADEGYVKLDLLDLGYSTAVPYLRSKPIELCTELEKDGETLWQPLITVSIPAGTREPLVMIFPNGESGAGYKVYDLDPSVFPYGSYQLVNLTKVRLFARLDETGMLLQPGEHGHFKGTGQSTLNVWLRVAAEGLDKNSYVVYSSMMRNRSDKRMFMFFHPSDTSPDTPIAVRTLVDFAPQGGGP
jgi:hypothetical protein